MCYDNQTRVYGCARTPTDLLIFETPPRKIQHMSVQSLKTPNRTCPDVTAPHSPKKN